MRDLGEHGLKGIKDTFFPQLILVCLILAVEVCLIEWIVSDMVRDAIREF